MRRGRTPSLGFWVVLLLLITFFGGAFAAVLMGVMGLAAIMNVAMLSAVVIGVPLTAIAALVDKVRHRSR